MIDVLLDQVEVICEQISQTRGPIHRDVAIAFNQLRLDVLEHVPPNMSQRFESWIQPLSERTSSSHPVDPETARMACAQLLAMLRMLLERSSEGDRLSRLLPDTSRVFIVHGHDRENALRLERLLKERWGMTPVVLADQPSKGRTIIEKFEDEAADCAFALILLTPDDLIEKVGSNYHQARPNVLFELGWFYGRLGREHVCLVYKRGTNIPSDLGGIGRVEFTDRVEECALELETELKAARMLGS